MSRHSIRVLLKPFNRLGKALTPTGRVNLPISRRTGAVDVLEIVADLSSARLGWMASGPSRIADGANRGSRPSLACAQSWLTICHSPSNRSMRTVVAPATAGLFGWLRIVYRTRPSARAPCWRTDTASTRTLGEVGSLLA